MFDLTPIARESYTYWRADDPVLKTKGYDHLHACCWLGNEQGEWGFKLGAAGDKVHGVPTAFGPAQHHQARIDLIKRPPPLGCGIDIKTASHVNQLRAINWESSFGAYKHVRALLGQATTVEAGIAILVRRLEQSAHQDSDIAKRTAYANHWMTAFSEQTA